MTDWVPTEGEIVVHINRPEWGPGKVVLVQDGRVYVFFRDYEGSSEQDRRRARRLDAKSKFLERAQIDSDPVLDNLPPFVREGDDLLLEHDRMTLAMAKKKFFDTFPGGFDDEEYLGGKSSGERRYKLAAHARFIETLGGGQLEQLLAEGDVVEAASRALAVVKATNLLSPYEMVAFTDALGDKPAAGGYLKALAKLLAAPAIERDLFDAYLQGFFQLPQMGKARLHTWPVCTTLPYLADPARFMHLRPTETREAAKRLAFDLKYESRPNWTTYRALQDFAELYQNGLSDLGCRDMIDVQSFIWVTCGGYDEAKK